MPPIPPVPLKLRVFGAAKWSPPYRKDKGYKGGHGFYLFRSKRQDVGACSNNQGAVTLGIDCTQPI